MSTWGVILMGFLFHNAFELFNRSAIAAVFFPVNESVWEHLKLGVWPVLLTGLVEYTANKASSNLLHTLLLRILVINGTVLIVFYTYTSVISDPILLVDIMSFVVGVILGQGLAIRINRMEPFLYNWMSFLLLLLVVLIFAWFSFETPEYPIFRDGRTGHYGYN